MAAKPGKQLLLAVNTGWEMMRAEKGQEKYSGLLAQSPGPDVLLGQGEASSG